MSSADRVAPFGTATAVAIEAAPSTDASAASASAAAPPVYRMQLQPRARVTFDDSVVDNEHLGRKKSNKCCVFHKKRAFGESSSESGDDSDHDEQKNKTPHGDDCPHRHRKPLSQRPTKPHPFVASENDNHHAS